jgi:hypothetical protein
MIEKIFAGLFAALGLPPVDQRTLALLQEQADQFYPLERIEEFATVRDARQDAIVALHSKIPLPGTK